MRHPWLWSIAMLAIGCDNAKPASPSCEGTCIADPNIHCVETDVCRSPAACPSGLACTRELTATPSPCHASRDDDMRCRWRAPRIDTTVLVFGFRARSMTVSVTSQPLLEINWTSPSGARFIACGVFTCNPFIEDRPGTAEADTDALGNPLTRIGNIEACLREFNIWDSSRTSAPLGRQAVFVASPSTCHPEETLTPAIDFLAAACWAYDDYHIIAASDLVAISPDDYAKVSPLFDVNEDCTAPGVDCYNRTNNFFGRCAAGACQPYCITAEDCDLAAQAVLGRPKTNTCDWDCALSPTSVVGGCVPK